MRRLALVLTLLVFAAPARAQLVSPGRLAAPHADVRTCTQCHELRQPGIAPDRCLACHDVLAARIAARTGYHERVRGQNCARCHKDHLGADAPLVRMDTTAFRHDSTGYVLRGAHAATECRACHNAARITAPDVRAYAAAAAAPRLLQRTYLGLPTACAACHRTDSPHDAALNQRACSDCHDENGWDRPSFAHDRTDYPLTGAHRAVTCAACHERTDGRPQYEGLRHASCADCHRDPHAGRFGAACSTCHETAAWRAVDAAQVVRRFDHSRTSFPLREAHARIDCARCHDAARAVRPGIRMTFRQGTRGATYPRPVAAACTSCHVDAHAGTFRAASAVTCTRCHGEAAWTPVSFDATRHAAETRYALRGGHLAVSCSACHRAAGGTLQFRFPDVDCRACHERDDPHDGRFGARACSVCHVDGTFRGAAFDHARVGADACLSCHVRDDVHRDQFAGRSCGECHTMSTYRVTSFDHARARFPLAGAHAATPCASCHPREGAVVRYRPLPVTCAGCHGGAS